MRMKNTSDNIEAYIKQILAQAGYVELKRSEIADVFQVVPSQINYVIKTRFTASRGYVVESKRGGGGYIRIGRVEFSDDHQFLSDLYQSIGEQVSAQVFDDIVRHLFEKKLLSQREGHLLMALARDGVLGCEAGQIRARMLRQMIECIDRKGEA